VGGRQPPLRDQLADVVLGQLPTVAKAVLIVALVLDVVGLVVGVGGAGGAAGATFEQVGPGEHDLGAGRAGLKHGVGAVGEPGCGVAGGVTLPVGGGVGVDEPVNEGLGVDSLGEVHGASDHVNRVGGQGGWALFGPGMGG
jgi:hypothetical protein